MMAIRVIKSVLVIMAATPAPRLSTCVMLSHVSNGAGAGDQMMAAVTCIAWDTGTLTRPSAASTPCKQNVFIADSPGPG